MKKAILAVAVCAVASISSQAIAVSLTDGSDSFNVIGTDGHVCNLDAIDSGYHHNTKAVNGLSDIAVQHDASINANTQSISDLDSRLHSNESFTAAINADVQQDKIQNITRDQHIADNSAAVATEANSRQAQVSHLDGLVTGNTTAIAQNTQGVAANKTSIDGLNATTTDQGRVLSAVQSIAIGNQSAVTSNRMAEAKTAKRA